MQGDMTEAMKTMDSGMAAADMELRAARRAVPAAEPAEVGTPQHLRTTQGAATAASGQHSGQGVGQSHASAAQGQQPDLLQQSGQQQTPGSGAGQVADQPAPAAPGSQGMSELRRSAGEGLGVQVSASMAAPSLGAQLGSNALPAAGALPPQSTADAASGSTATQAQQPQTPAEMQTAADPSDLPEGAKAAKPVTDSRLQIHADSSDSQCASPTQPVTTSSSTSPTMATPCPPGQTTAADSTVAGGGHASASHDSTAQESLPATGTGGVSKPVHSADVHSSVGGLPGTARVSAPGGVLSPASCAESAAGDSSDAALMSALKQAGNNGAAVDSGAASQQQGLAGEPWAADEGDFAVMLKDFLVCLAM